VDRGHERGPRELGETCRRRCVGRARLGLIQAALAERDVLFPNDLDNEVGMPMPFKALRAWPIVVPTYFTGLPSAMPTRRS